MSVALNLRLQAAMPSIHVCFASPLPPHLLNQEPPGAQQLTLPDFRNVPHLGHVIVRSVIGVIDIVLIGFLTMSFRSVSARLETYLCGASLVTGVAAGVHAVRGIDPKEPPKMSFLLALDRTQAAPQSFRLKDSAFKNILSMSVTLDTSHFDRSQLNALA